MNPPEFIAEVSSNHTQDLSRCLDFIEVAKRIGCSGIKFQLFRIDELFASEILDRSAAHRSRKEWQLPVEFLPELADRCRQKKISFGCTPFYLDAVEELAPYVDFYKIASYELLWQELLKLCGASGKPVILSTGMAELKEIENAVQVLREAGCKDLSLLHCVSGYPVPARECNLASIKTLRDSFSCRCGWSDHSRIPAVIYRALHRWQADIVEFHLDLDGLGEEYAKGHCWLPGEIEEIISNVRSGFMADGKEGIIISSSEVADREWRADPIDGLRPLKSIRTKFKL